MSSFCRQLLLVALVAICLSCVWAADPPCDFGYKFDSTQAAGSQCVVCPGSDTATASPGGSALACDCAGFNRKAGDTTKCGACIGGKYNDDTTAMTTYTVIPLPTPATYAAANPYVVKGVCKDCPANSYCVNSADTTVGAAPKACTSIGRENGAAGVAGTTCGACSKGFFWNQAKITTPTKQDNTEGTSACTRCPAGRSTSATGTPTTACSADTSACPAATVASAAVCDVACTAGVQFSNSTTGLCSDCSAVNRLGNTPAGDTCGLCTDATYSADGSTNSNTPCIACSTVNRASAAGTSCGACVAGYYGEVLNGTSGCVTCTSRNRTNPDAGAAVNTCGNCVTGFFQNGALCLNCSSTLNRANGGTANTCGACNAGFVGTSDLTSACVTQATWDSQCAAQNRVIGASYPACGACIPGAAGGANASLPCTVCTGATYPATGATACASCAVTASQSGNGGRPGPTPACTACNTTTGICTACASGSFPLAGGQGCEYRCPANQAPTNNGTVWPCETCLTNGCTACSNVTGLCTACPTGYTVVTTAFGGCATDVSTVIPPVAAGGSINGTGSQGVIDATATDRQNAANPSTVAELLQQGVLISGVLKPTTNAAGSPAVVVVGALTGPVGTTSNVSMVATINGQTVTVIFTVTVTDGGVIVSGVVANPALFSDPSQQLPNIIIQSVSVTPYFDVLPATGTSSGKMRRLSSMTTQAIPAGASVTLQLNGAVPAGRTVWCGRALPGRSYYETYEVATPGSPGQYKCNIIAPEGASYALVTLPTTVTAPGATFVTPSYKNYHTDVGLGVGLGVGIPVLLAILIAIFCCIGRPVKAVGVPTYGYGVPAPGYAMPAPVNYAAPY